MRSSGQRQSGFSLVELMVAMVIGLVIILGAGQLFLNGFQSFRQVEALGDKQAAITFLTEDLMREVRRGQFDPSDYRLARDGEGGDAAMLEEKDSAGNFQALVGGLMMPVGGSGETVSFSSSSLVSVSGAVVSFSLDLEGVDGGREAISFIAVDRTAAVSGTETEEETEEVASCNGPPWPGGKPDECK